MRAALVSASVVGMAAMTLVIACRTTQPEPTSTRPEATPMPSAPAAVVNVDAAIVAAVDAAPAGQTARFHLVPSTKGRSRRFTPGVAISRIDDAGVTPAEVDPPHDDPSNGALVTASPLTPGHYRAHFLVATCAADSPDGGCHAVTPKPDDVEFDVPATGDATST